MIEEEKGGNRNEGMHSFFERCTLAGFSPVLNKYSIVFKQIVNVKKLTIVSLRKFDAV